MVEIQVLLIPMEAGRLGKLALHKVCCVELWAVEKAMMDDVSYMASSSEAELE